MKVGNIIAASAIVAALGLPAFAVAQTDTVDSLFNRRDQLQDTITESYESGAPPPPPPGESAIDYQLRMHDQYDRLYLRDLAIGHARHQLFIVDAELSDRLSKHDPRRSEIVKALPELVVQWSDAIKTRDEHFRRREEFYRLIQDYKKRTGSYPPHDCASAPGWHLPEGAKCDGTPADPHAGSSGHGP